MAKKKTKKVGKKIGNNAAADNLKATIEKTERYVLLALSSATVFLVLSLAQPKNGDVVEWELLGFPLSLEPPLALAVLYLVYIISCLLADNMILHVRDLTAKLDSEQMGTAFSYPSVLTVSPIGRFIGTVIPAIFMVIGVWNVQQFYPMHYIVWWFAYGFGLISILVYLRVRMFIVPCLDGSK